MNPSFTTFETIPIGSTLTLSSEKRDKVLLLSGKLPTATKKMTSSTETGAFIRGLTKQFDVSLDFAPQIAFLVLQICIGERELKDIAQTLQTELGIAATTSQLIAQDLEKELFRPLLPELNKYWAQQKQASTKSTGAPNVLDLKNRQ